MRKIINNPFTHKYPTLDIHGETIDTCVYIINTFINDNIKLGKNNIIIIHGKGSGKLKSKTHELLKKDKRIKKFYIDMYNEGQTIVELILVEK